tara:strand:+ start:558 stop:836 length:279 start_codon:yes stop_codon:yes gene_type:complete
MNNLELQQTLGMMSEALAQLLIWAKSLENKGLVPKGALENASLILDIRNIQQEIETLNELKSHFNSEEIIRELNERTKTLKKRISDLQLQLN